ncbi:TerB family tellurite resistance protein [Candidatus Poribacteria bacterium]|nr:TerB family tellurite resistance protein [Candidatus Poribacteria bacterium]
MIRKILELVAGVGPARSADNEKSLTDRVQVATCVLLLEIAHSDDRFTEAERSKVLEILKKRFQLADDQVAELLDLGQVERKQSSDLWRFTNMIDNNYSREEKERVVECLWKVVYADGRLDVHEDHLIHRLSKLLNLSHRQLIDAKKRVMGWD